MFVLHRGGPATKFCRCWHRKLWSLEGNYQERKCCQATSSCPPLHVPVQHRAADLRLSPTASPSQAPTGQQNAASRSGDGTGLAQLLPLQIVSLLTSFLSDSPQLHNWHGCNSKLQWQALACLKQGQHAKPKAESLKREFEARAQNWLWKPSHPETFFDK